MVISIKGVCLEHLDYAWVNSSLTLIISLNIPKVQIQVYQLFNYKFATLDLLVSNEVIIIEFQIIKLPIICSLITSYCSVPNYQYFHF